ncbi:MAG: Flp pilus assembly complex ATPase component TadA [Clostridia bacterium]|nr:Flp pilus assembly complex ATPase component TadA [Clostridia bacterium]
MERRQPIGIELVRRGVINEHDIQKALEYQKTHPNKKMGDILNTIGACDSYRLIQAIGEIMGEKAILLDKSDIRISLEDYISPDVLKQNRAIPFDIEGGRIKVCFSDTANRRAVDTIRLLLLNKGLIMEKYITFDENIEKILKSFEGKETDEIISSSDITGLIDTIIKKAMDKRASDIHFEPMENELRIRYRIDGELFTAGILDKEKQAQVIGRLKAISNMHQEKQESQDGRILLYPDYNIRVSSQKNVYGEKFVLRLLKKNADIKRIFDLGFPQDEEIVKNSFNKKNSITIMAAPTGEGKTTTLYSVIDYLNKPEINVTTIEDPVEIRISGLNQIEIDSKTSFSDSLRTVLRQDPDIILVGEIRDKETAEIAMQAGQTGHYVLSTIHTIDSIEVITRLRKMGVSNYDIASTLATSVSQRLVRKICPHCARQRPFTDKEMQIMNSIASKNGEILDFNEKVTYDAVGCSQCNNTGYYDRIGVFEILNIDDEIRELITMDASTLKIKEEAMKKNYRPLVIDGIRKVLNGVTTLEELNKKLVLF